MAPTHATSYGRRLMSCFSLPLLACCANSGSEHARVAQTRLPQAHAVTTDCNGRGGKSVARTELFFGLTRPDGSIVSAEEFQRFVDREVTPRFPDGLTLLGGYGQFRNARGITVKEGSKMLILLYAHDHDSHHKIESIRDAYARNFHQESVLRVDDLSCVSY